MKYRLILITDLLCRKAINKIQDIRYLYTLENNQLMDLNFRNVLLYTKGQEENKLDKTF